MPGTIKGMARVLKDNRPLVLAIVHPMYSDRGYLRPTPATNSISLVCVNRSYFQVNVSVSTDVHWRVR